jgi:hypothetical protein
MAERETETVTQPAPRPGTPSAEKRVPQPVPDEKGKTREDDDGRDQPPAGTGRSPSSPWLGGG